MITKWYNIKFDSLPAYLEHCLNEFGNINWVIYRDEEKLVAARWCWPAYPLKEADLIIPAGINIPWHVLSIARIGDEIIVEADAERLLEELV